MRANQNRRFTEGSGDGLPLNVNGRDSIENPLKKQHAQPKTPESTSTYDHIPVEIKDQIKDILSPSPPLDAVTSYAIAELTEKILKPLNNYYAQSMTGTKVRAHNSFKEVLQALITKDNEYLQSHIPNSAPLDLTNLLKKIEQDDANLTKYRQIVALEEQLILIRQHFKNNQVIRGTVRAASLPLQALASVGLSMVGAPAELACWSAKKLGCDQQQLLRIPGQITLPPEAYSRLLIMGGPLKMTLYDKFTVGLLYEIIVKYKKLNNSNMSLSHFVPFDLPTPEWLRQSHYNKECNQLREKNDCQGGPVTTLHFTDKEDQSAFNTFAEGEFNKCRQFKKEQPEKPTESTATLNMRMKGG